MEIEKVLAEYDGMFGKKDLKEIEAFLVGKMKEAKEEQDFASLFTLLNESIGFYRDTTQKEKALKDCDVLQQLLKEMQLEGRLEYATALLNIANAYRAFGLFEESLKFHREVEETYKKNLRAGDFAYASLYNNWSLLYQELGDFASAKEKLMQALDIVDLYPDAKIQQATTRTNLAVTLLQLGGKEDYDHAVLYLKEALEVFEADGGKDFHYGAALVAMGDAKVCQGLFQDAAWYYKRGMEELEKHVGKTENYDRVKEKYENAVVKQNRLSHLETEAREKNKNQESNQNIVQKKNHDSGTRMDWESNLERCRKFYETYGAKMIHEKFPEYEERIAVGLVGEGSDCFGYEDEISKDHDYGLGFCMWLCKEDHEKIGEALQKEYEELICHFEQGSSLNLFFAQRRGVFTISDFYNRLLGTSYDFETSWKLEYSGLLEENLATAVNGVVFRDDFGLFLGVRKKLLEYYPDNIWRLKLAQSLHEFSQYAQSNYPRMMARKDYVTANLCIVKAMESTMDLVFLLNKTYAPYYKWKRKAMGQLRKLQEVGDRLDKTALLENQKAAWSEDSYSSGTINRRDKYVEYFEDIAEMVRNELREQGLVTGEDTFLENYCGELMMANEKAKETGKETMDRIKNIVELEWKQFDKVKNEGGRADCQDDWNTFSIMRKSQYLAWTEELLESYYGDLLEAEQKGWNLITEKYARMMKSTAPEKYAELEKELPVLNQERISIQEEIIKIQVGWMEAFAEQFPKMAGNARVIHTAEDTPFQTSYETYLRGELGTYSETTFLLYGRFVTNLLQEGKNLAYEIMNHTAKLYGYLSVEDAEEQL
ncbi:MAG: DUF4125 family protein [Lachnospiraceae bacterium]|nr:DUF4125 family protein [Lachnospiraceae bacterium]